MRYPLINKSRTIFTLGVSLLAIFISLGGSEGFSKKEIGELCFTKSKELIKSLPEKVGNLKKDGTFRLFNPEKLYDYMDGGAEQYLKNGFVCLFVQEYQRGEERILLEVYQFEDLLKARKMYFEESAAKALNLGQEGSYGKWYLAFYLGSYLVKGLCFENQSMEPLFELGRVVEKILIEEMEGRSVSPNFEEGIRRGSNQDENRIILIGASYAKGWNPGEIAGTTIVNKGVAGEQSFEMLSRFEKDVISLTPQAVIIWGFINDIFRSKREEIESTLAKTKESYIKMVKRALDKGIIPILATEVTIRGEDSWREMLASWAGWAFGKESYQDYVNKHVLALNQWIKEYAETHDLLLLDLQPAISDERDIRKKEYATEDGSHISPKGYERLTSYAREALKNGSYPN